MGETKSPSPRQFEVFRTLLFFALSLHSKKSLSNDVLTSVVFHSHLLSLSLSFSHTHTLVHPLLAQRGAAPALLLVVLAVAA